MAVIELPTDSTTYILILLELGQLVRMFQKLWAKSLHHRYIVAW